MIIFLDDNTQNSKISFFKQKSEIFEIYQSYLARNKKGKLYNHCFQIDEKRKYDSNK